MASVTYKRARFSSSALECHYPARPQQSTQTPDGRSRIRKELEHQASDDCIKRLNVRKGRDIHSMERRVIEPNSRRTLPGSRDGGLIQIDGGDPALGAYELCDEHRHVAHPAADVQHPHPRNNSSIAKEMLCRRRQHPSLPNQPEPLAIRMAENVI
jgi:hypothetical protein